MSTELSPSIARYRASKSATADAMAAESEALDAMIDAMRADADAKLLALHASLGLCIGHGDGNDAECRCSFWHSGLCSNDAGRDGLCAECRANP